MLLTIFLNLDIHKIGCQSSRMLLKTNYISFYVKLWSKEDNLLL